MLSSTVSLVFVVAAIVALVFSLSFATAATECKTSTDCVPSVCCHAPVCVAKAKGPTCSKAELLKCNKSACEPFTLDCGGSCACSATDGKCVANLAQKHSDFHEAHELHAKRKRYTYQRVKYGADDPHNRKHHHG